MSGSERKKNMNEKEIRLKEIELKIANNPVCLFLKGSKEMPQCGFSAKVVHILDALKVEYTAYDVLEDLYLREDIKEYSNWPTLPQLYIKQEFIGGCDIVMELFETGELQKLICDYVTT